ncbi:MAG: hypothetical protein ACREQZ_00395 [Woeseiaceae bacterium]
MRLLIITSACAALLGCGNPAEGPEESLRRWVAEAQDAAENRDRAALMRKISGRYADARGNDRKAVDQMLRYYFLRQDQVLLVSRIDGIEVSGETAGNVRLTTGMAGTGGGAALDFRADAYRFELELEHDGDDWMLIGARWGQVGQALR